jgi:hypothetical protein
VRIHLLLPVGGTADTTTWAAAADEAGVHGLLVDPAAGLGAVTAPPVALATTDTRVIVPVVLGPENPITLAEELLVIDALSAGRVIAHVDTGELDAEAALEDVALLRRALSGRPIRHRGARWQVPAGIAEGVSEAVIVTPGSTQLEIAVWLTGAAAEAVAASLSLPVVATDPTAALRQDGVQPATAALTGELDADRDIVGTWATAGATHLIVSLPPTAEPAILRDYVARFLIPEVAMVDFPRLLAETTPPPAWPGASAPVS